MNQLYKLSYPKKGTTITRRAWKQKTKFNCTDDLLKFQISVWEHLKDTGMDTIAYVLEVLPDTDLKSAKVVCASELRFQTLFAVVVPFLRAAQPTELIWRCEPFC